MDLKCSNGEATDPRVRRTRGLLLDAMRSLIHEKRYSAISVQDVAERATVNRATFYAHFVDKDDLLASLLRADLQGALNERFPVHPPFTPESVAEFAAVVFEYLGRLSSCCPKTGGEVWDTVGATIQESIYELVDQCVRSSNSAERYFPGRSVDAVVSVISWSIYGAAYRWSRTRDRRPAIDVCREVVSILLPQGACSL